MRFDPPTCPECGADPQGTLETVPGCAEFDEQPDGSYEYSGSTNVFWDGQMTTVDRKDRVELMCKGDGAHSWFATKAEAEGSPSLFRVGAMVDSTWDTEDERFRKFTVGCDPFDLMTWTDLRTQSDAFDEVLDPKKLRTAPELGQDVFDAFYKMEPELKKEEHVDPEYGFNRSLMEKAWGTQEYQRLRAVTALQESESAIASEVVLKELMKELPKEDQKAVNEYFDATQKLNSAQGQVQGIQGLPKIPKKMQGVLAQLQKQMPALQKAQQAAQAAMAAAMANPQARAAVRAALAMAGAEVDRINDFGGGWGMEAGTLQKVPAKDRIALMRRIQNSKKIKELQKYVGRYKRLAFQKRYTRIVKEPAEVVDVTRGSDLSHVVSSELALLADEDRELEFYGKYLEGRLLIYDLQNKETVGRGPIIMDLDCSGSMDGAPEMWSKALGLAVAEIALKDKRVVMWKNFSSRGEVLTHVVEPTMSPTERMSRLIACAEEFYGGGTDFEQPLNESLDTVEQSTFKKADIILITDGIAPLSDAFVERFLKLKREKGVRLHAILIGGTDESVTRVADEVHHVQDLVGQGDKVAGSIFEAL